MIKKLLYKYFRAIKRMVFPGGVQWSGNYKTWQSAQRHCSGYAEDAILEKVKNAAMAVKNGEACYERDSVLFYKPQIAEELVASLLKIAKEHENELKVLDFGGSLASLYYQNRQVLSKRTTLEWSIVEQKHYVECGRRFFENEELRFFNTIDDCLAQRSVNVILAACVLQYVSDPYLWIKEFVTSGIQFIIFDRMGIIEHDQDMLTIQKVPPVIYEASYPCFFFNKQKILSFLDLHGFVLIEEWSDRITAPVNVEGKRCYWSTLVFKSTK